MTDTTPSYQPSGQIVADNVALEDYLEHYAHDHYEWVEGALIKMAPANHIHTQLVFYFARLLFAYIELRPIALIEQEPFTLHMAGRVREPDVMVILNDNPGFTQTGLHGAADICIEVVSPESIERDYVEKLLEYERAGVQEYWIIDWLRKEARFHQLGEHGTYANMPLDADDNYHCRVLPDLKVHVPTLWQTPLPGPRAIARAVDAMLNESSDR